MSRYLAVLRTPGALIAFLSATVARLPISMATLGAVLLVQEVRDSYALAGAITGCFALGTAVGTPWWGRLLDRRGQGLVLAPTSVVSAALLVVFAVGAVEGAPTWLLVVLASAAGLSFPPLSPAMRAAWQVLLPQEQDRQAAYALEAVAIEMVFILGPLLLSLLLATTPAAVPLIVTAGLLAAGALVYVSTDASRRATATRAEVREAGAGGGRPLLSSPRLVAVLFVAVALSLGFGNLDVSVAGAANEVFGNPSLLGVLYIGVAGGSAAGGLWYGARTWRRSDWSRLPVVLLGCAAGLLLAAAFVAWVVPEDPGARVVLAMMACLFVPGVFIAPALIIQQNLVDALVDAGRRGEAQSWLNASLTAGAALGTALAGGLLDAGGASLSFVGAGLSLLLAAFVGLLGGLGQSERAASAA